MLNKHVEQRDFYESMWNVGGLKRLVTKTVAGHAEICPTKLPHPMGDLHLHITHSFWAPMNPHPKWHLDLDAKICPTKLPVPTGYLCLHTTHSFLGSHESTTKTAS